jgi:hypothetical protein
MGARFPVGSIRHVSQVLLIFAAVFFVATDLSRAQATPVEARISSVSGSALLLEGTQTPSEAKRGDALQPGQEIDTRGGGHLTIELSDGSLVIVAPGSRILLKDFRAARGLRELLDVLLGRVRVKINHFGGRPNPYRINSPTASIAVRGTEFSVTVDPTGETEIIVYHGLVEVASLADPRDAVLVHPGRGVIVHRNSPMYFFEPNPGNEIGGPDDDDDIFDSHAPQKPAGVYDSFLHNLGGGQQYLPFLHFTAHPDSFLDGQENPAYATEFSAPEGRAFFLPSFRTALSLPAKQSAFYPNSGESLDYNVSPQISFFTPLPDHRTAIGGGVAVSGNGIQLVTIDSQAILTDSIFPPGTSGARTSSHSTSASFLSPFFVVAHALGKSRRTSLGVGFDKVEGRASILTTSTQADMQGTEAIENIDSRANLSQTRIKVGLSQEFSRDRKLGIYYSYAFVSSDFGDVSHRLGDRPQDLDTMRSAGHSSAAGIRFRGVLAKRLFYGAYASWFFLALDDQLKLSPMVNCHEHDRGFGSSFALGLTYALRPRIIFSFDLGGGFSSTATARTEDTTGNLLERSYRSSPNLSTHEAVQADLWRNVFGSVSLLTVRQTTGSGLTLYPDRFGRLLTTDGVPKPNGLAQETETHYAAEFGAGWHFTKNFLGEYVFSTNQTFTAPRHSFLFRYTFRLPER